MVARVTALELANSRGDSKQKIPTPSCILCGKQSSIVIVVIPNGCRNTTHYCGTCMALRIDMDANNEHRVCNMLRIVSD